MSKLSSGSQEADRSIVSLLLGFLGVTAAFLLLPKTIKYVIRRFVLGIASEIVAVVITGLLTEKLVHFISEHDATERLEDAPQRP
ncbi:MAG: hypothetical protein WD021_08510 [Rhodothermales bacterium]